MKNIMRAIVSLVGIMFLSQAAAADKVLVIPLESAKKKRMNFVSVSTGGGDFADPAAAVNSITDAAAANPYLVQIGPGIYTLTQTLVMKPHVTVAGSGRDATTLTGAISSLGYDASSALVAGADDAILRDLTIHNSGGGAVSIGVYNNGSSPVIREANITASGGRYNYGIYNISSAPEMTEVTATASGGMYNYGVFDSSPPDQGR